MKNDKRPKIIYSNNKAVITLDSTNFQFLIKALQYPQDFDGQKVIDTIITPNTKIVKKKPTVKYLDK